MSMPGKDRRSLRSQQNARSRRQESIRTLKTLSTGTSVGGEAAQRVGCVNHVVGISYTVIFDVEVEPTNYRKSAGIDKLKGLDLAEPGSCCLGHLGDDLDAETTAAAVLLHSDEVGDLGREAADGFTEA
jgi:hypothetical protein